MVQKMTNPHAYLLVLAQQMNFFQQSILLCRQFFFIGHKTVTLDAHPMQAVQRWYSAEWNRRIGCASSVTVLSPIKTKDYTHVFSVAIQFVPQPTWNSFKTTGWLTDICPKITYFGPPKTGTRLYVIITSTLQHPRSMDIWRIPPPVV